MTTTLLQSQDNIVYQTPPPEILELVDKGDIAFTPAVELSYLTDEFLYAQVFLEISPSFFDFFSGYILPRAEY